MRIDPRPVFFLLGLLLGYSALAQEAHNSMPWENPLYTNPALTGKITGNHRVAYLHRRQWGIGTSTYQTNWASYDLNILKEKWSKKKIGSYLGAGVSYDGDEAGDLNFGKHTGMAYLSYSLKLAQTHDIAIGVAGGVSQYRLDLDNAQWDNQYTNGINTDGNSDYSSYTRKVKGDLTVGAVWSYFSSETNELGDEKLLIRVGVAFANLIGSKNVDRYDPRIDQYWRINVHAEGYVSLKKGGHAFQPYVLFSRQGPSIESVMGTRFRINLAAALKPRSSGPKHLLAQSALFLGAFYRTDGSMIVLAGMEIRNARISVGYDMYLLSDPAKSTFNSLELAVQIILPNPLRYSRSGWTKKRYDLRLKNH